MKHSLLALIICLSMNIIGQNKVDSISKTVLVIHGGAGMILKSNLTQELEQAYTEVLTLALEKGYSILLNNGTAIDAVQAAINVMEDSPLFNAGRGSVYTHDEKQEMDASIMSGIHKQAGAVAGVSKIKNPINAAIAVMNHSEHVMLSGSGAEEFAQKNGLELADTSYFFNSNRLNQLRKIQEQEKTTLDHDGDKGQINETGANFDDQKFGTVGAVALDQLGNLAAGTSTGGMTNKRFNRIGDSPIIGAGTYADNRYCAVSCTGHGEYFIRNVVAYDVCALMNYKEYTLDRAAEEVVQKLTNIGGKGGLISIDSDGNHTMQFNTSGMFRGYITESGEVFVAIYGD